MLGMAGMLQGSVALMQTVLSMSFRRGRGNCLGTAETLSHIHVYILILREDIQMVTCYHSNKLVVAVRGDR